MRVLIAGCGYVGSALAERLVADGHWVAGLRRRPAGLPAGVVPVAADLATGDGVENVPGDLDACVAALSADGRSPDAYRAAYVDALATLRGVLADTSPGLQRWCFTSSTAVHGDAGGDWIDEDTPPRPGSFTGAAVLAGERLVLDSGVAHPTVLRLGGIYGPGRTRLLDQVRTGQATCPPEPTYTNRIHRDDAAGALAHLLTLPDPPAVLLGVDRDPAERCEVLTWLADQLGAPPPRPGPGSTRGNKRCRSDRLVATGYAFRYPTFREGYAAMLGA